MSRIHTIKKNIILVLFLAIMTWTMVMYNDYSSMLPLLMFVMILVVEGVSFFVSVGRKKVFIRIKQDVAQYQSEFEFELCVSGKSRYPFKMTRMLIEIKRKYGNDVVRYNAQIPMNGEQVQTACVTMTHPGCGYVFVEAKAVRIYDALGIFSKKYKKQMKPVEVVLLPKIREVYIDLEQIPYIEVEESEVFAEDRAGNDSSELFGVREFMDGDSLNKVHWKLSARTENTMVREFSMPVESNVYVYIDLYRNSDTEKALQDGLSAAYELMAEEIPFFLCWLDTSVMGMRRQQPKDFDEIDSIMCKILRLDLFERNDEIDEVLNRFSNEFHVVYPVFRLPETL